MLSTKSLSNSLAIMSTNSAAGPRPTATVVVLVVLLLATAALPWSTRYVPAQDGPNHLIIASIFRDLMWNPGSLNAKFYQIRPHFFTSFGTEAVGLVMLPKFGWVITEKFLFTAALIGVPVAIIAGIYAVARRASPFMVLALPYGYPATLANGNFNFLLSSIVGLGIFAAILGRRRPPTARMVAGIGTCGVVMVLIHPAPTVVFLFLAGLLVLGRSITLWLDDRRAALRSIFMYGAAALPMITLLIVFLVFSPTSSMEYQRSAYLRLREFLLEYELYKLGRYEIYLALMLSAMLAACFIIAIRTRWVWRFNDRDWLLVVSVASFALYMISPNKMSGGDDFVSRIEILPWVLLLMWLAAQPLPGWVGTLVLIAGTLLQCTFLAGAYRAHAIASRDIAQYFDLAATIPRSSVIVPVIGDPGVHGWEVGSAPMAALHNAVAIEKNAVFLNNWDAHFRISNIEYRPDRDPYRDRAAQPLPFMVDNLAAGLERYEHRTGIDPDGILIWRLPPDELRGLKSLLKSEYEPVAVLPGPTVSGYYRRSGPGPK